ncbi:hypothetical protein DMUE_5293 [Dictyocoela muelleri]|nr:hypothetical protein DMUE_5293 [Dictyocoela muelleri]
MFHTVKDKKKEIAYDRCFKYLKNSIKTIPQAIIIDFEKSLYNSLQKTFINSNIFGCNFHFSQSLWRQIQSSGNATLYKRSLLFKSCLKRILSLSFFSISEASSQYFKVKKHIEENNLSKYFENFYYYLETNYKENMLMRYL